MARDQLFEQPGFIPVFSETGRFAGMSVGITGSRGVLGRILASRLQRHDIQVFPYSGDVTDSEALATWGRQHKLNLFFHFAAIVPLETVNRDPARALAVNAGGAHQTCREVLRSNPSCWVFLASSSHVYRPLPARAPRPLKVGDLEEPGSVYGRTKLAAEHLCRQFLEAEKASYCIGRIFSFSHSSQGEPYLVPTLMRKILEAQPGQRVSVANASALRDIMDAETVIDAVLHLALRRAQGTLNIG
jgi:UDP-glucose 4-epimerase/GDP-4-dehydro-6-deoxy-D-mannose reductase